MTREPMSWVVDDEPALRKLLQEQLEKQGFDARTFADASNLEHAWSRERPDLMVLDLMLPGYDGLSV
jgi:DNA-binding response OmpR family regulator